MAKKKLNLFGWGHLFNVLLLIYFMVSPQVVSPFLVCSPHSRLTYVSTYSASNTLHTLIVFFFSPAVEKSLFCWKIRNNLGKREKNVDFVQKSVSSGAHFGIVHMAYSSIIGWFWSLVNYGVRSSKFIWAPCHVMCSHWLRPRKPPAFGLIYEGRYWSAR